MTCKDLKFKVIFPILMLGLSLSIIYVGLYALQPVSSLLVRNHMVHNFPFLEMDNFLGWKNKKNSSSQWPNVKLESKGPVDVITYTVNSRGERVHKTILNGITTNKYEVWILGDSSPFGLGVSADKTFAHLLSENLKDKNIYVRNLSVIGYKTAQILKISNNLLKTSKTPKLVILWVGFNDVEFTHSIFWYDIGTHEQRKKIFKKKYNEVLSLYENLNTNIIAITPPSFEPSTHLDFAKDTILHLSKKHKTTSVLDIRKQFKALNDISYYANVDNILPMSLHPSVKGHKYISELLLDKIIQENLLSLPPGKE